MGRRNEGNVPHQAGLQRTLDLSWLADKLSSGMDIRLVLRFLEDWYR